MTLLLGPPGAGKTTLLKALAGKLQNTPDLKVQLPVHHKYTARAKVLHFLLRWDHFQDACWLCNEAIARLKGLSRLQLSGSITYNGEGFDKFYPQRTAAYVDQVRLHRWHACKMCFLKRQVHA